MGVFYLAHVFAALLIVQSKMLSLHRFVRKKVSYQTTRLCATSTITIDDTNIVRSEDIIFY